MRGTSNSDAVRFSIIIPTYNRCDDLLATLESMRSLSSSQPAELIVVDNNSTDRTRLVVAETAKSFPMGISYLFEPEQGRCAALNAGIKVSRGDIILVTDDDVRVPPDWTDIASTALEKIGCDYVG